ncbi:LysR family transcriptional regulator [Clostridium ihumii]
MDIKQLQYFVVSVDMGSFHAAAETLITTQPNVSKVIKSLEEELNMKLLNRNRTGVTITKEGEKIYRYALEVLKNMKLIKGLKKEKYVEKLSIGSVPSNKLSTFLAEFYNNNLDKNIEMDFCECSVEEIIKKVHRRDVELGVVHISKRNMSAFMHNIKSKGMEYTELRKVSLCLFLGKNSIISKNEIISQQSIKDTKLIQHYEDKYSLFDHLGHLKEDAFYIGENTSISYTNSDSFLIQLLKNTDFCSIGTSLAKDKYEYCGIQVIPITECEEKVSFGYIKRSRDELSDIGNKFIIYLKTKVLEK